MLTSGPMTGPIDRAGELAASWARRPSRGISASLRIFYGQKALALPLLVRAELCVALGEAAELEGRFEYARYLYASAVSAADPERDERLYARAAVRSLLNASRIGDRSVLTQVARVVEGMPAGRLTPRLACLGAAGQTVVNPLLLAKPFQCSHVAQYLEMPGNPGLALTQHQREPADRQLPH